MNFNNYLCVTKYNIYIYINTDIISNWKTITMINFGAIGNFMSFLFAQQNHVRKTPPPQYGLKMANGLLKMVNEKVIPSLILIEQYNRIIIFGVSGLAVYNVILHIF